MILAIELKKKKTKQLIKFRPVFIFCRVTAKTHKKPEN